MNNSKKFFVANWKMNPENLVEAKKIFSGIKTRAAKFKKIQVVICPPSLYLATLSSFAQPGNVSLGVQNTFYESSGSFTGEISPTMARWAGASYAIVGHSERRALGETDEIVNKKAIALLREGISTIVCIGEKTRDTNGDYLQFLKNQIQASFHRIPKKFLSNIIVAYEPIWAIGKSDREAMKGRDVHETSIFIKKTLGDIYGPTEVLEIPILYGGSTSAYNVQDILEMGEVDGLLVGRQSLNPESFGEMFKIGNALK